MASIVIDDREVRESLKALKREGPKAIDDALKRTAFEIRDAEAIEVKGAFTFSSSTTERFLANAFLFQQEPGRVAIFAKPGARAILTRQQFGAEARVGEPDVGPVTSIDEGSPQLAVPTAAIKRGARGKIPVTQLPGRLTRRNKRGRSKAFRAGKAVLERVGSGVRLLYTLTPQVRIKPRLDFFGVAASTARREFPRKAERVLEKIRLRGG